MLPKSIKNPFKNGVENHDEKSIEKWCQNDRKWEPQESPKSTKNLKNIEKNDVKNDVEKCWKKTEKNQAGVGGPGTY